MPLSVSPHKCFRDAEFSFIAGFYLFSYYVWQMHRFFHLVRFSEDILRGSGCVKKGTFRSVLFRKQICHSKQCATPNIMLYSNIITA